MDENKPKKCHFCGSDCTDEDYCYGCKEFICADCDEIIPIFEDAHEPHDHQFNVGDAMKEANL